MNNSKITEAKTTQTPPMRLERETTGKAVEVSEGLWLLATNHHPGLSKHMVEINNRCFVFRLVDARVGAGGPVLVVVNAVDPLVGIPEVRRLEHETGLAVRYIISPGGGHHLLLRPWHDQFTQAQVLVGPVRIPRTANGQTLMKLPRVSAMDLQDPLPSSAASSMPCCSTDCSGPSTCPRQRKARPTPSCRCSRRWPSS